MMVASYDPVNGWSAPEIKPYGPLLIDPASSCLQYATNVFEGMKVSSKRNYVLHFYTLSFCEETLHPSKTDEPGIYRLWWVDRRCATLLPFCCLRYHARSGDAEERL